MCYASNAPGGFSKIHGIRLHFRENTAFLNPHWPVASLFISKQRWGMKKEIGNSAENEEMEKKKKRQGALMARFLPRDRKLQTLNQDYKITD